MSVMDTDALLRQASGGDDAARQELLSRFRDRLRRMVAVRMDPRVRKRVDPSDIVQETLIQADRRLEDYLRAPPLPFFLWLRQLAWDQLVACHRKHLYASRRSQHREEDFAAVLADESISELAKSLLDHESDPLGRLIRSELRDRVRRAIEQLPETYRDILVLRHLEELSTAESAQVLAISASAAKMRHLRAVEKLQALLDASPDADA